MADTTPATKGKFARPGCFTGCFIVLLAAWLLLVATTIPPQAIPWALYRAGGYDTGPAVLALVGAIFLYCLKLVAQGFWGWLMKGDEEDNGQH